MTPPEGIRDMTPFRPIDTNDHHDLSAAEQTPSHETRVPWVPTSGDPSDVLATFDTISRRLGAIVDDVFPEDDGPRAA
jgi:hypothetical protein